ncbi:MAG: CARDB domain-containing protein, partial [Luteolibacter sp.]
MSLIKEIRISVTDVNEPSAITNVTAGRRPGSKLVDVSYNLSDPDANTTVSVSMVASADNGVTWDIPVSSATGDIGPSVKAFQDNGELSTRESLAKSYRTITWDAGSNWNDQKSESMKVRLTVGTASPGAPAAIRGVNSTTITSNVFALNTIGNGTFSCAGAILDQTTNQGLSGVTISMNGSTATSDAGGWFRFDNVAAGPITYSKANYNTITQPSPLVIGSSTPLVFLGYVTLRPIQPNFTGPAIDWYTQDVVGTIPHGFKVQINFAVHVAWGSNSPARFEVVAEKTPGNKEIITTLTGPGPYNFTVDVDRFYDGSFDPKNNQITFKAVPVAPALPAEFKTKIATIIPLPQRLADRKPSEANKMQFPPMQVPGQPPRSLNHLGFDYTIVDLESKVEVPALGDFGFAFKAESHFDFTINDGAWENAVIVGDIGLFGGQYRGAKRFSRPGMPFEIDGERPKLELYLGPRTYSGAIAGIGSGNASPSGINPSTYEVALALKREDGLSISAGQIFPQLEPVDWLLGEITLFNSVSLNGSARIAVDPFKIEEGTIGGSIGRRAEYEIGSYWVATASAGIGGVANATFRLPPPILKDAGIRFFATWGYSTWFWSDDGEFTIGEFRYTAPSQFQPSGDTPWKITERKWREGGVEAFLQTPRSGGMAILSTGTTTSRISPELALFNQLGAAASVNVIPSDPNLPAQAALPLLANVMPLATPSLAQRDGKLMLAYIRDTGAANPVQFTEAAFSYYDGTSWTTPGPIAADARGQIDAHVAFAGNGDAIAVWGRIKDAAFADTTGPEQMAPQLEIVSSRWSSATRAWGPVVALTNNSILDHKPILSGPLADGDLMLSWVRNPSNELKGSGAPGAATNEQHLVARWDTATSTWGAPTVVNPSVTNNNSVAFAARGNKAAFVWIQDLDGDPGTKNDTELYSQVWNGTSWGSATRVTNDLLGDRPPQVAISPSGDIYTLWVSGTDLVMQTNFTGPRSVVRSDSGGAGFSDCTLTVADNGRVLALWQAMSATGSDAFYRVFDPASNTWGLDDQLSRDSSMEKSFSAVWDSDSNLVIAYNNVEMVPTTRTVTNGDGTTNVFEGVNTPGTNDLLLARRRIVTDLALVADSFVAKADTFLPGSVMALKATLKNTGNLAVQNATVTFYLGDPAAGGTVIGSTTVNGWLRASEERVISQNWTIPGGLTQLVQIYAVADPASAVTEFDETNNRLVYETSGKDLELSYLGGTVLRDGSFNVSARVLNTGVTDSPVTDLRLWTGLTQTAAPISNEPVGRLAPGRSADVTFRMPAGSFAGGDQRYNMVLNSSARDAEINQSDNQSSFTLSLFIDDDGDGIPLEWETANGQSDSNPTDGNGDSDGDGFTNRQEYLAGTNPRNRTSVLKVGEFNVQAVPGSLDRVFTISWASVAEKLYVVERSTDFVTWAPVASGVTATAPLNTWRDEPNAATRVFYRVRVQ